MTSQRVAKGAAAGSVAVVAAVLLGACGMQSNLDWQCGTYGRPPINVDASLCERGISGVKWYAADPSDLEADDISQIGLPLDDDYYERDTRKYKPTRSTRTVYKTATPAPVFGARTTASKPTTKSTAATKTTASKSK